VSDTVVADVDPFTCEALVAASAFSPPAEALTVSGITAARATPNVRCDFTDPPDESGSTDPPAEYHRIV